MPEGTILQRNSRPCADTAGAKPAFQDLAGQRVATLAGLFSGFSFHSAEVA